ncbi:hypothetical protein CLV63_1298 [Murinocardiopsis flavida]|uniref:Uncharacterized protein n=1 Tax=Murinocardiopsis flavida TaxID=645275 RepID=A0A2P8CUU6_9ACTN|nr:hypothetical protein [Murinocardiopsis flavida]PSK88722.1 hypothetical protein CLV63_1298 [Murinocardiopsis flavida]
MKIPPAEWSTARFGENAAALARALGDGLSDMQDAVLNTQGSARSKTRFASGQARMTNQHERLTEKVMALGLPDTFTVRPDRAFYELVVVGDALFLPYCDGAAAQTAPNSAWPKRTMSGIVKELFTFALPAQWVQDPFEAFEAEPEVERSPSLASLPENTRLVLVPYTMNLSGLLQAWWGEAALLDDTGALEWKSVPEQLPVRPADTIVREALRDAAPAGTVGDRFDAGDLPEVALSPRRDGDRQLEVPPVSEIEPMEPKSQDDDQD